MKYKIKAHPTKYSGVLFRSRLEARWAAFFDLVQRKWAYEEIDFEGWSPDFTICHLDTFEMPELLRYVEVKPFRTLEEWRETIPKIVDATPPKIDEDGPYSILCGIDPGCCFMVPPGEIGNQIHPALFPKMIREWGEHGLYSDAALWAEAGNKTQWRPR